MRHLIKSVLAAGFIAMSFTGYAADAVKTGSNYEKPGRAIEDDADIKTRSDYSKPGRAIEEAAVKAGRQYDKPGRAIETEGAAKK